MLGDARSGSLFGGFQHFAKIWLGPAWLCMVRQGRQWQGRGLRLRKRAQHSAMARRGEAGHGLGQVRRGKARRGAAMQGLAWQGSCSLRREHDKSFKKGE